MARIKSPSMPTKQQVKTAFEAAKALCPDVRIKAIGPDGVTFDYPGDGTDDKDFKGKPFSA